MIYEKTITTPKSTTSASPQLTTFKIEKGIIKELFINFPPGPSGLLYLQIKYGESIIFPKSTGNFHGDNVLFQFHDVGYKIYTAPYELVCVTWNTDDKFNHDVDIYINLVRTGLFV